MKFTTTELVFINVMIEQTYEKYVDERNEELRRKQYKEAALTKRHMEIMESITEKIREELGI